MKENNVIEQLRSGRFFCLDTETTGFSPENGDKIIEVGIVEISEMKMTEKFFHKYINPCRTIPKSSSEIHGITDELVKNKEKFSEISTELRAFIGDNIVVAHNSSFDKRFLDFEFAQCNEEVLKNEQVFDSLKFAREKFPGAQCSLDALCRRFSVDATSRKLHHGALVDARLLAKIFIKLMNLSLQKTIDNWFGEIPKEVAKREDKMKRVEVFYGEKYEFTEEEKIAHNSIMLEIGNSEWQL